MDNSSEPKNTEAPTSVSWVEFFLNSPSNETIAVNDFSKPDLNGLFIIKPPSIRMYCDSDDCMSETHFDVKANTFDGVFGEGNIGNGFIVYLCRHCRKSGKIYSIHAHLDDIGKNIGSVMKYGEHPPSGKRVPSKLKKLVADDWSMFKKGWKAEQLNMGIAAFGYYRRVLDNQRKKIIDALIKAAKSTGSDENIINEFEKAKNEKQFSRSIDLIRSHLPKALYIDGHNPLTLLHDSLSDGIHDLPDDKCLGRAKHIIVVLTALLERVSDLSKDNAELKEAVASMAKKKSKKKS